MEGGSDAGYRPGAPTTGHLELLVETVTDYAIFLLEPDGRIASWNRGAARLKGYAADEIIGRHFSQFYTDDDRERGHPAEALEIACTKGRFQEEGWRVRRDGSRFWADVVITCLRDVSGEVVGYGKVTRDLSSRRLSEERLRAGAADLAQANAELEQFRRLVAAVRDYAIFMLDPGGHIATWNPGAEHIKGYSPEEAVGRHFSMFYTAEDRARNHPGYELEVASRDGRYEEEAWRVRKDGTRFWANVVITAVRDEDGALEGFAKITRDLTSRREGEQALRAAQEQLAASNAELQRFAAVAAHDLIEPLRTVAGFAGLMDRRHRAEMPPEAGVLLDHIGVSLERMQELIEGLLQYARAGVQRPATDAATPVADAVDHVLGDLHAAIEDRGAELTVALPAAARVEAETPDVEMVLRNLLSNALKFADRDHPRVGISGERGELGWRVVIADNGIGIAEQDQMRVFGAFQRLHAEAQYPGTGLGLSICQRIVDRCGGQMGVESTPGQGARFWFELPSA